MEDPEPTPGTDGVDVALRGSDIRLTFVFGKAGRTKNLEDIEREIEEFDPGSAVYAVYATAFAYTTCEHPATLNASGDKCTDGELPTNDFQDWERGHRGWDGVDFGYKAGPCSGAANSTYDLSTYQQNPCNVVQWIVTKSNNISAEDAADLGVTELVEAGSDMFLNWVYRTITSPDIDAFGDNDGYTTGDYDPESTGAGDDRLFWMNDVMQLFFEYYGW
jgi:hypothetical protein